MATGDAQQVSSFPHPPMQYVSKYSDENIANGNAPEPPPPLALGSNQMGYSMFGVPCNQDDQILRSLESQNVRRIYPPSYDRKRELTKLNFSILANFLDLLDIITTQDPKTPKRVEKLDNLTTLFINMHHLVNEYRPQQARDSLREMMIHQAEVTRQSTAMAERYLERSEVALGRARSELNNAIQNFSPEASRLIDELANKSLDNLITHNQQGSDDVAVGEEECPNDCTLSTEDVTAWRRLLNNVNWKDDS